MLAIAGNASRTNWLKFLRKPRGNLSVAKAEKIRFFSKIKINFN